MFQSTCSRLTEVHIGVGHVAMKDTNMKLVLA